jgi:tetratricopeptide (TPR) repeat protein
VRAKVLTDPSLAGHAGRFAWLSINTEDERNAAFLERYEIAGLPTFLVVDPDAEAVALRWLGGASAAQFARLFEDGERAVRPSGAGAAPDARLAQADRLAAEEGKAAAAADLYRAALEAGGPGWTGRSRALDSLVTALSQSEQWEACARLALAETPVLERGPTFANLAATGLGCADRAPDDAPWKAEATRALEPRVEEALGLGSLSADDRSSLYGFLAGRLEERGDEAGARAAAGRWMELLDAELVRARGAEERAALDGHRVSAALMLGDPARALPAIEASERDLPGDYNPPARRGTLLRELGRFDESLAAYRRALGLAYGPRKLRIYEGLSDAQAKMGDPAGARATLDEALRYADSLPEPQRPERLLEALRKKREGLPSA